MAGGKETPRQKMIGMMYLVLTALLALNVSKQIIQAFVTLNDKIEAGNTSIHSSNEEKLTQINARVKTAELKKEDKALIEELRAIDNQAQAVHNRTRNLSNFFILEASAMIEEAEQKPWHEGDPEKEFIRLLPLMDIGAMDNYDIPTNMFVEDMSNPAARGLAIEDSIMKFRDFLLTSICNYPKADDPKQNWSYDAAAIEGMRPALAEDTATVQEMMEKAFVNANPDELSNLRAIFTKLTIPEKVKNHDEEWPWIGAQFDHAPIVAAAAIFTSLRSDLLQAEGIALNLLTSRKEVPIFEFDKIDPVTYAKTSVINSGDSLAVSVKVAAYNSKEAAPLKYWVDDSVSWKQFATNGNKDVGEITTTTNDKKIVVKQSSSGKHQVYGYVGVKERGSLNWKPFSYNYDVAQPMGTVSQPEMRVLYRGYDNLVEGAASGYPGCKLSGSGCSLSPKGKNQYIAKPGSGRTAKINVSGVTADGKSVSLGSFDFDVRPMPNPSVFLGGIADGSSASNSAIRNSTRIIAKYGDGIPLKASFKVIDFKISVSGVTRPFKGSGASISGAKSILAQAKRGGTVTISCRVKGPDGVTRKRGCVINVK